RRTAYLDLATRQHHCRRGLEASAPIRHSFGDSQGRSQSGPLFSQSSSLRACNLALFLSRKSCRNFQSAAASEIDDIKVERKLSVAGTRRGKQIALPTPLEDCVVGPCNVLWRRPSSKSEGV